MKRLIDSLPGSNLDNALSIHYLHIGNTTLHKPYADKKGIHCAGDSFGYIVDWQITEKKNENAMTGKAPH